MSDPTTLDFAVYDGGLLGDFLSVLGALLPADERELAEAWLTSERRLMEVLSTDANGVAVQDLLTGYEVQIRDRTIPSSVAPKDLLYGRPLDDGTGTLRFRNDPLTLPRLLRSPLLDVLRRGADVEEIAALLAPPGRALDSMDFDGSPELPDAPGWSAPELAEADLAGIRRQNEDRWLADTIPALGGLTPREAAASDDR